jgi:hypothetical protein
METPYHVSLTPEQLAAISAGGGFAECEDPTTHVQYQLIRVESPTISDEYIRQKVEEAYAGNVECDVAPLDMTKTKTELQRRLAAKQNQR